MGKLMDEAFNYTSVSTAIKKDIKEAIKEIGKDYELIMVTKASIFDGDNYLYLVMARGGYRKGYTTWLYNSKTKSLFDGHYDMDFKVALIDFAKRLI